MKINLIDLVSFCNKLDTMSSVELKDKVEADLKKIIFLINDQLFFNSRVTAGLEDDYANIKTEFSNFEASLVRLKAEVYSLIEEIEQSWLADSDHLYKKIQYDKHEYGFYGNVEDYYTTEFGFVKKGVNESKFNFTNSLLEQIQTRQLDITPETKTFFENRINNLVDWRFPGMIIGPKNESFINHMVANDPLYLVDEHNELLTPTVTKFSTQYQQRLRKYVIDEIDKDILKDLPNDAIGLCVAYNYFEYRPIEVVKKYINEIYNKLKPGGILAMSFNDCDRYSAIMLAERQYACYTPGRLLYNFIKELGFEIVFKWNDDGPVTWLELQKPGELSSIRGGQTLAKITHK